MYRDRPPNRTLGFGIQERDLPVTPGEQEGADPESGVFARALNDNPLARFFAVTAATIVGAHTAGRVVRGGYRFAAGKVVEASATNATAARTLKGFRETQSLIDEWQGVSRTRGTRKLSGGKVVDDPTRDETLQKSGFFWTQGEIEKARELGMPSPAEWTTRDAVQQRLVRAARRLPYEIPAAYVTQRALTDKLFGSEQEGKPKNWLNPIEVFGDFAEQSVKNVAFAFLPFEAGAAAGKQGWNRALTMGAQTHTGVRGAAEAVTLSLNQSLQQVGHEASALLANAVSKGQQTSGALSTALKEASAKAGSAGGNLYKARHGPGGVQGFIRRVYQGQEGLGMGPFGQIPTFTKSFGKTYRELGQQLKNGPVRSPDSTIERIGVSLHRLGRGGSGADDFTEGAFWQGYAQKRYREMITSRMVAEGVNESSARRFASQANFVLPHGKANLKTHISKKVTFGKDPVFEGAGRWEDAFVRRIQPHFRGDADAIGGSLERAVRLADMEFAGSREYIEDTARGLWRKSGEVLAPQARAHLGVRRAAYDEFGEGMSPGSAEWLVRRSAERLGVDVRNPAGGMLSTADIRKRIAQRGLDAHDNYQMRSFLVDKGDISKPWRSEGFNWLGLRPMSVQEAMDRNFFGRSVDEVDATGKVLQKADPIAAQIRRLGGSMKEGAWDEDVLNRLKVGHVYNTISGGVVDFSPVMRAARSVAQTAATEFQIPFIHVKPAMLFGAGNKFAVENSPLIQFSPGFQTQPFLPGAADKGIDTAGHFWFRSSKGTKGRVTAIGTNRETGDFSSETLAGNYRPRDTDPYSFAGRNIRMAIGDLGRRPDVERNRFKSMFAIDEHQPDSFGRWFSRFRQRKTDMRNPARWSEAMRDGRPMSELDVAEGTERYIQHMRSRGVFGREVVNRAPQGSLINRITRMQVDDGRGGTRPILAADATETQLRERFRWFMDPANEPTTLSREQMQRWRRSRRLHIERWVDEYEGLNALAPQHMRDAGIHQRIDEMRASMIRMNAIEEGIGGTADDFTRMSSRMLGEVEVMRARGQLEGRQVAEARAAVGSLQLHFMSTASEAAEESAQQLNLNLAARLRNSLPPLTVEEMQALAPELGVAALNRNATSLASLLDDVAEYATIRQGPVRGMRRFMAQRWGSSEYEYPGTEINPFGGGRPTAFVPTFGSALRKDPFKATRSAVGIGTWSDPDNYSGAGMVMSHMVMRMNRVFGSFGLGLDPNAFGGPLAMLSQGMVARRAVPLMAVGAAGLTVDRTLGGMVNEKDMRGERVYSPLILGGVARAAAEGQVALAGIMPGGNTAEEERYELFEGESPVRKGRWWPLGNTPWRGGRVQYYRPSWYRRLMAAPQYTDQQHGSPLERFAFGYDFSPLRPLDPYRWEREHQEDRPYPVTGDYFTGPWGPVTPFLNATIGRILKPQRAMHEEEVQANLARFQQVGAYGMAAPSSALPVPGEPAGVLPGAGGADIAGAYSAAAISSDAAGMRFASGPPIGRGAVEGGVGQYTAAAGSPAYVSGSRAGTASTFASNAPYVAAANSVNTTPIGYPFQIADASNPYQQAYARRPANVMPQATPQDPGSFGFQVRELAYRAQEFAGIYGFTSASIRSKLGFGEQDFREERSVYASPSTAYGSARQFWDWSLGGLGDFPTPLEGEYANLELSEVVRRFIPKPRRSQTVNPIANTLGVEHPWLPGADYMTNFHWGDPYAQMNEGENRLPGQGYERLHRLHPDETGLYGRLDRFKILADVAPYSDEFRAAAKEVRGDPRYEAEFMETMRRVEERKRAKEFSEYQYRYSSAEEQGMSDPEFQVRKMGEWLAHRNTYFNTKFMPNRSAVEDWERQNVYGASFAQWQNPVSDFLVPAVNRAAERNPISAAAGLGFIGRMFGASPRAKALGSLIGAVTGASASIAASASEAVTGDRFIPAARRREVALEEYTDILQYTKARRGYARATQEGNQGLASQFSRQMRSTMYGADIQGGTLAELTSAIPKRKREHFEAFLTAPVEERGRILSTAGRLERRIYQAAWGMRVEQRPDLEEYFSEHELPDENWEGWDPRMNMEVIKLKMIQQQGLDASQMGYYPQQVEEANLMNPSYPDFRAGTQGNVRARLEALMTARGINGSVREIPTPYSGTSVRMDAGVF